MAIYNIQGVKKYDEDLEELLDQGLGVSTTILEGRENYDFCGLNFDGLKMNNVVLDGHYFDNCTFRDADLSGCTFKFGHFRDCDFTEAKLSGTQFLNCNMRHTNMSRISMQGGVINNCMMKSVNFWAAHLSHVDFSGSDLRKARFCESNCRHTVWTDTKFTSCDFRSTLLFKTVGIPRWMRGQKEAYDLMPPDHKCISWKLLGESYRGIYRPHMVYEVGKTYDATRGGESPIDATLNPGIALASLDWVLKEWMSTGAKPNWHLFMVEFNAGDVVSDSHTKFTVSKLTVLKEVDLTKYTEELGEEDIETMQVGKV